MFFSTPSVRTLTIVTDQGKVMYLTKNSMFDIEKSIKITMNHKDKYGSLESNLEQLITSLYNAGVRYKIR